MMEPHIRAVNLVCAACGVVCVLLLATRRFSAESVLKRAIVGCLVCLLAMVLVDGSGDAAGARLREAAGLPMAVGMGAVVLFVVLRQRLSS